MTKSLFRIRSSLFGLAIAIFFSLAFFLGNLKETPLYKEYLPYTQFLFQTMGFDQRWGMYGYDYLTIYYTRYVYEYSDNLTETVYPRYWQQKDFNPFRFVKSEDFQWIYNGNKDEYELMSHLLTYLCSHPENRTGMPPLAIGFQVAKAPFPNLQNFQSIYSEERLIPEFKDALWMECYKQ